MNERLLGLAWFMLVLFIIIQIVYKSCTCVCTCEYWCTVVTRPSTVAYSRSPLLAVFQGHVSTFPPPPVYWIVHCVMVHYTAPHLLRVHCLHCTVVQCTALLCTSAYLCTVLCYTVLYWEGWGGAACGAGTPTTALLVVWPVLYKSDVLFINCRFIYFLLKFYKTNSFYI